MSKIIIYCHREVHVYLWTCNCGYMGICHTCYLIIYGNITTDSCLDDSKVCQQKVDKRDYYNCRREKKWRRLRYLWNVYIKSEMSRHLQGLLLCKKKKKGKRMLQKIFKTSTLQWIWGLRMWWLRHKILVNGQALEMTAKCVSSFAWLLFDRGIDMSNKMSS